jgi:hypothetical protein
VAATLSNRFNTTKHCSARVCDEIIGSEVWAKTLAIMVSVSALASVREVFRCCKLKCTLKKSSSLKKGFRAPERLVTLSAVEGSNCSIVETVALQLRHCRRRQVRLSRF